MHDLKTTYSVANLNITDHYKFNFRQLVSISRTDDFKSVNLTNQYIQWFEILRLGEIQVEIAFGQHTHSDITLNPPIMVLESDSDWVFKPKISVVFKISFIDRIMTIYI